MVLDRARLAGARAAVRHDAADRSTPTTPRSPPPAPCSTSASAPPGTAAGPQGDAERDAAVDDGGLDFLRERIRARLTVMAVAEGELRPGRRRRAPAGRRRDRDRRRRHAARRAPPGPRRRGHRRAGRGRARARRRDRVPSAGSEDIARVYAPARLPARRHRLHRRVSEPAPSLARRARRARDRVLARSSSTSPTSRPPPPRSGAAPTRCPRSACSRGGSTAATGRARARERWLAAAAGVLFAIDILVWHYAIRDVGAGLATVLGNLQVVVVPFLALAVLGERVPRSILVALPPVCAGVLLVSGALEDGAYGVNPARGALLGVATGLAYAAVPAVQRQGEHGPAPPGGRAVRHVAGRRGRRAGLRPPRSASTTSPRPGRARAG